jgi:hypothetical protein
MKPFLTSSANVEKDTAEGRGIVSTYIPSRGERVAQMRFGVQRIGTVWYSDQLQVLVRWDEGTSSSLRLGSEELHVLRDMERDAVREPSKAA